MKLKSIIHRAKEGGYWAEVPAIPGCVTQGETFEELLENLYEAVEACLSVDLKDIKLSSKDKIMEIASEIGFWKSLCQIAGETRLEASAD